MCECFFGGVGFFVMWMIEGFEIDWLWLDEIEVVGIWIFCEDIFLWYNIKWFCERWWNDVLKVDVSKGDIVEGMVFCSSYWVVEIWKGFMKLDYEDNGIYCYSYDMIS